jgi:peptidyl-prolyl cis-trans isomerase SurA
LNVKRMQKSFLSRSVSIEREVQETRLQRSRKIAVHAVAGVLLLAALAGCKRTPNPDVLATVNGHPIMKSEVEKYFQNKISTMQQQPTPDEASMLKMDILHQRINEEVIRQRAEKMHLVATDAEVDAKIAQLKAPYGEQFDAQLKAKGLTLEDVRRDVWLSMTTSKVLNKEIDSKINITDADVANYYNLHKADFNLIEPQYHLAQIVVTSIPSQQPGNLQNSKARNDAEARKKIQGLHNQLESGGDFAGLAMNFSEAPDTASSGGDMGFIPESQLKKANPEFYNAITKLKAGQITDVLPIYQGASKQPIGYEIFKLIAVEPAGQHPLSDPRVQQTIRQQLHDSRSRLLQSAYYEVLRDQARVVNYYAEDVLKKVH